MNEQIRAYVENLFIGISHTRQSADVKEELLANLQAKYDDLLARGVDSDKAFQEVVSGIGDIKALLDPQGQDYQLIQEKGNYKKAAMLRSLGVCAIIFGFALIALFSSFEFFEPFTTFAFFTFVAIGVGLLVFAANISPKKYRKGDDTFVEEYKEAATGNDKQQRLRSAVSSTLWALIVVIYLGASIMSGWGYTWLIFIAGALAQSIIMYFMGDPKHRTLFSGSTIFTAATLIFFIISFAVDSFQYTWLVFVVAVLVQQLVRLVRIWREIDE